MSLDRNGVRGGFGLADCEGVLWSKGWRFLFWDSYTIKSGPRAGVTVPCFWAEKDCEECGKTFSKRALAENVEGMLNRMRCDIHKFTIGQELTPMQKRTYALALARGKKNQKLLKQGKAPKTYLKALRSKRQHGDAAKSESR